MKAEFPVSFHNSFYLIRMKSETEQSYRVKAWAVYTVVILIFTIRFFSHALLSQMGKPHVFAHQSDLIYRTLCIIQIPQFLTAHTYTAFIFDVSLFALPIMFLLTRKNYWAVAFSIVAVVYFLTYNIITGHHYHGLIGLLVISIPFWWSRGEKFELTWQGARYYFLYIFASAACWKIMRGSVFYPEQMSHILKAQHLDLLLQHPPGFQAQFIQYLIAHPQVSHILLLVNVAVQLTFLVGFFTKRFDTHLFVLAVVFCVANYFVMSIISAELLILGLTLLNWPAIEQQIQAFSRQKQLAK